MPCNLYVRFFAHEAIATTPDELFAFLAQFPEIDLSDGIRMGIEDYWKSPMPYPRRVKVKQKIYFLLIKTAASNLDDFKSHKMEMPQPQDANGKPIVTAKEARMQDLQREQKGWYRVGLNFRRVVVQGLAQKATYIDTPVSAYVYDDTPQGCYNQLVGYLQSRPDIDRRSQFPSARGDKYTFQYMGETLQ